LNQNKLQKISKSFNIDGVNVTCASVIVKKFNEYFTNIGLHFVTSILTSQTSIKNYFTGQPKQKFLVF